MRFTFKSSTFCIAPLLFYYTNGARKKHKKGFSTPHSVKSLNPSAKLGLVMNNKINGRREGTFSGWRGQRSSVGIVLVARWAMPRCFVLVNFECVTSQRSVDLRHHCFMRQIKASWWALAWLTHCRFICCCCCCWLNDTIYFSSIVRRKHVFFLREDNGAEECHSK